MPARPKVFSFATSLDWTKDHRGIAHAAGKPDIAVACPPVFYPESPADEWSPEDFFVSSVEVCLMLTFIYLVKHKGLSFVSYRSKASGDVEVKGPGLQQFTRITLDVDVQVKDDQDAKAVRAVLKEAKGMCLVATSIKTDVQVNAKVTWARS